MKLGNLLFRFRGSVGRGAFWTGFIILLVSGIVVWAFVFPLFGLNQRGPQTTAFGKTVILILYVLFAYPISAVMVKRLRDRGRPLWILAVFWTPRTLTLLGSVTAITEKQQLVDGRTVSAPTLLGWLLIVLALSIDIWLLIELGFLKKRNLGDGARASIG